MDILEYQIIFLSSILASTFLFSLIPLLCLRRSSVTAISPRAHRLLGYMNCVAGGVFMAMCFLGLLPLVQDQFRKILRQLEVETEFPVAECVIVLGFFFILTVEQLCIKCHSPLRTAMAASEFELRTSEDAESIRKLLEEDFDGDQEVLYELDAKRKKPKGSSSSPVKNGSTRGKSEAPSMHCRLTALSNQKMGLRFCVLVLALSIHAVFEGLALGLVKEKDKGLRLFVAMLLHECICAFALGVNTAKRRLSVCASVAYVFMFSLMVPSGIGLGLLLGETPGMTGVAVAGVLQAFAAGIFIHVTFMEIIPSEFGDGRSGLTKVLFLFVGFLTISAIGIGQEVDEW